MAKKLPAGPRVKVDEPHIVRLLKSFNRELKPIDDLWRVSGDDIEDTLSSPHPMEGVSVGPWQSNCYANIVYLLGMALHSELIRSVDPMRWVEGIIANESVPVATDIPPDDSEYWGRISEAVNSWAAKFNEADLQQLDIRLRNEWKRTGSIEAGRLAMDLAATLTHFKILVAALPVAAVERPWHKADETPPSEYPDGPLTGTKQQLARWIMQKSDHRLLETPLKNGTYWGREDTRTQCSVWFKTSQRYAQANAVRLTPEESTNGSTDVEER